MDSESEILAEKVWVGGIVNVDPRLGPNRQYAFYELDTTDEKQKEFVLEQYKKYNLDVVVHRIGKGYHFFGGQLDRQQWIDWKKSIKHLNERYPPLTLRVTKKYHDEVFEKPVYHEAQSVLPNWSRALMSFLCKEIRNENSAFIQHSMQKCGLYKYFTPVTYRVSVPVKMTKFNLNPNTRGGLESLLSEEGVSNNG